jgi:hypothetical protein
VPDRREKGARKGAREKGTGTFILPAFSKGEKRGQARKEDRHVYFARLFQRREKGTGEKRGQARLFWDRREKGTRTKRGQNEKGTGTFILPAFSNAWFSPRIPPVGVPLGVPGFAHRFKAPTPVVSSPSGQPRGCLGGSNSLPSTLLSQHSALRCRTGDGDGGLTLDQLTWLADHSSGG